MSVSWEFDKCLVILHLPYYPNNLTLLSQRGVVAVVQDNIEVVDIDAGYRRAACCRICFAGDPKVRPGIVDMAQPRWIGERYAIAKPRVLFILMNPGSGESDSAVYNEAARHLMREYGDGRATLADVLTHQRAHMPDWGRGRFLSFYTDALGLKLDDIAFLNIALCSTEENSYPSWMLHRCFDTHTGQLIRVLGPDLVLLSGRAVEPFRNAILNGSPRVRVETMLHYAHRKSNEEEARDLGRIRATLESLRYDLTTV